MDLITLIKSRKSIRAYQPDMPPRDVILECLEAAAWAPNPTNQQPWQFIVLTGKSLRAVSEAIVENYAAAADQKEQEETSSLNFEMSALLEERKNDNFSEMMSYLLENDVDMQAAGEGMFNFQYAPAAVLFGVWPCKDQNYLKAVIAAMENFMLAATARGLGTCWMNAVSICQEHIKQVLKLSDDLILVDGLALGYPDDHNPLNRITRRRLPIDSVTVWKE